MIETQNPVFRGWYGTTIGQIFSSAQSASDAVLQQYDSDHNLGCYFDAAAYHQLNNVWRRQVHVMTQCSGLWYIYASCSDSSWSFNNSTLMCERETGQPYATDANCKAGEETTYTTNEGAANVCIRGCWFQNDGDWKTRPVGNTGWTQVYKNTGNNCNPDGGQPEAQPGTNPVESPCVYGADGSSVCLEPTPLDCGYVNGVQVCQHQKQNCGEFNGQEICTEQFPQNGQCTFLGGGNFVCDGSTQPPAPAPGTPTPQPEFNVQKNDGTNETVFQSSHSTGSGGGCGGTGEPPCKIDETGTPSNVDNTFFDTKLQGMQDLLDGVNQSGDVGAFNGSFEGVNPLSDVSSSSCASITIGVPPWAFTFPPPPDGCEKMETLKGIMAWVFYIATALYLLRLAMRRPA